MCIFKLIKYSFFKATTGAAKMVKSKSMEVVKAVSEDLTEVKDSLGQYTAPISKAGGALKTTLKEIDEITDEMAESALDNVSKGATSLWSMASGYASQMFVEDDVEATPVMVGNDHEPSYLTDSRLSCTRSPVTKRHSPVTRTRETAPARSGAAGWRAWTWTRGRERYQN